MVDNSLKMRTGKICSQVGHACMMFLVTDDPRESEFSKSMLDQDFEAWMEGGMKKCILRAESSDELNKVEQQARDAGLHVRSVIDAGLTTFGGRPTKTCVAIGPSDSNVIDSVTGKLKLL